MHELIEELAAIPGVLWIRVERNTPQAHWRWIVIVETEWSREAARHARSRGDYAATGWGRTAGEALARAKERLHTVHGASLTPPPESENP